MDDTTSPGSTTTGPASFAEAFAADASSASNPTPETTPAASASADTIVPPAADGSEGSTPATGDSPQGPIPFDRHKAALENARAKAIEEWDQQYGWAKQVQPQEFQQIQQIARHFAGGDVLTGIQSLLAEARKDPAVDAQLRSFHARALAAARGQQPAQAEQEPQPDLPIQLEDGRVVHLYSAEQQAKREAFLQKQWLSQVKQEFQPVTETVEAYKAREAALAKQQEIAQYVESTHADVVTWPGMDDKANQVAVAEELKRMRVNEDDPREVSLALNAAWRKVVAPKLSAKGESTLLENLQRKAAASTSINPGSAASTTPRSYKSFNDLPAEMWR